MKEDRSFNLGWHESDILQAQTYPVYVLVPADLGAFRGSLELERISFSGLPLGKVSATMAQLASPRLPEDAEGMGHPVEMRLIRRLQLNATRACNTLPEIEPSKRARGWAKLELNSRLRSILLRAGGAA